VIRVSPNPEPKENSTMAMSENEILEGLAEIVNEETGIENDAVEMDKSFTEDLDIDSLSMMTIVVNAEDKFGVRIPDDEVKNLTHVRDAVTYIASNHG
jgi:acyl carrier protein